MIPVLVALGMCCCSERVHESRDAGMDGASDSDIRADADGDADEEGDVDIDTDVGDEGDADARRDGDPDEPTDADTDADGDEDADAPSDGDVSDSGDAALDADDDHDDPCASTSVFISLNLDARSPVLTGPFDPTVASTYTHEQSVEICDSLGHPHLLSIFFLKIDDLDWEQHIYLLMDDVGPPPGTLVEVSPGANTLIFTSDGALDNEIGGSLRIRFGEAGYQHIALDYGTSISGEGGTGLDGTTSLPSDFTVREVRVEGCCEE